MVASNQCQSLQVLIVEDCPDTANSFACLLRHWGHQPTIARNGAEALAKMATSSPDVILLDIGLPGMDGWELARWVRSSGRDYQPLLVAMSGYCREEDRELSRQAGCHVHLAKPVDLEVLRRLLRQWQQRSQVMTPSALAGLVTDLGRAAEVVEAIDDPGLQLRRGWNLSRWHYDLVPWGVRFRYQRLPQSAEVVATLDPRPKARSTTVSLVE